MSQDNPLQADSMSKDGLVTVVINEDMTHAARMHADDLWAVAETKAALIFLSPEQLNTRHFWDVLKNSKFWHRIVGLAVDEAHLILSWGAAFRRAFAEIGLTRAQLQSSVRFVAVTTAMEPAPPLHAVAQSLGL